MKFLESKAKKINYNLNKNILSLGKGEQDEIIVR